MFALSIDTSTAYLSLALQKGDEIVGIHIEAGQKHAELILPTLEKLLKEHSVSLPELEYIVYAQGPGSFTGLRIGIGVAQGLSLANNTPLIGIPTLDTLAFIAPKHPCVLTAIDARMSEVFYAWFNTETNEHLSDYQVGKPDQIIAPDLNNTNSIGIGNAYGVYDNLLPKGKNLMPSAEDYLKLAATGIYPKVPCDQAELLYVRNKIALTAAEQAKRKA